MTTVGEEPAVLDMTGFSSLELESGGGQCAVDCTITLAVRAPGVLMLTDGDGKETFELEQDEYNGILSLLSSPQFYAALQDLDDCYNPAGGGTSIKVSLSDGTEYVEAGAASCVNTALHPYSELYSELVLLKRRYLDCPEVPTATDRRLCRVE